MGNIHSHTFREHANIISQIDFLLGSSIVCVCFGCRFSVLVMYCRVHCFHFHVLLSEHTHRSLKPWKWNFLYAFSDCASKAWVQFNFTLSLSSDVLIWSQFHTMVSLSHPLSLPRCVLKVEMYLLPISVLFRLWCKLNNSIWMNGFWNRNNLPEELFGSH